VSLQKQKHPIEKLVDEVEFRQRNTTYPDLLVNASNADALMWKGSRRITKIQRVGLALFGLVFLLSGISMGSTIGSFGGVSRWLGILIGAAFAGVGCKLLWNSVRKNAPSKMPEGEDDL
jgi:hypothetical protein